MIKNKSNGDVASGLILMLLAVVIYFYLIPAQIQDAKGMPLAMSPRLFCKISSLALFLMSLILLVSGIVGTSAVKENEYTKSELKDQRLRAAVSISISILYIILINKIGYFVSTSGVLLFFSIYFGARDWKIIILSQVAVLAFIYAVFVIGLKVILPSGIFF